MTPTFILNADSETGASILLHLSSQLDRFQPTVRAEIEARIAEWDAWEKEKTSPLTAKP